MDNERKFESVYSTRVKAGKRRTYFFDVRTTKGGDYYLTLTESTKRADGEGYSRHKLFLYKEDFNRFLSGLEDTMNHVKTELMPDYDYDEFTRRHEEWEAQMAAEAKAAEEASSTETVEDVKEDVEEEVKGDVKEDEVVDDELSEDEPTDIKPEDDLSW